MRKKKEKPAKEPEFISVRELCERWGAGKNTVYDWINAGKIPVMHIKFIRDKRCRYKIPMDWVLKYERDNYIRPSRKAPKAKAA